MTNTVVDKYKKVLEGVEFAVKAHGCQTRKGTDVPYIVHPVRVARILIEYGCPEDVVVAGLLHDTVEDTTVNLEDIRKGFGYEVAEIVKGASEPDKEDTWENRKRHTLEYLKTAPKDVLLVACADKLDNIREIKEGYTRIGEKVWDRFKRGKESQQWYYQSLAEIFVQRAGSEKKVSLFHQFNKEVKDFFDNCMVKDVGEAFWNKSNEAGMTFFQFKVHHEAVPQKVKDLLHEKRIEESIHASINFYQEYDMIESMKLILSHVSIDHSLKADTRISILNNLLEIILLFYPTSTIGKMGKTNFLCLLALEAEKISDETALPYYRHVVSSLFPLFTIKKIGKEERSAIFKEVVRGFKRIGLYSKKSDSIIDPIANSLVEKLRIGQELPKGLLPRKAFDIDKL